MRIIEQPGPNGTAHFVLPDPNDAAVNQLVAGLNLILDASTEASYGRTWASAAMLAGDLARAIT